MGLERNSKNVVGVNFRVDKSYLTSLGDVKGWFERVPHEKLAFDTETTDLNYSKLDCVGMSFCNGIDACYLDLTLYSDKDTLCFLKSQFETEIKKLIMHNSAFDLKVLWKLGIRNVTENIFCTMTAAQLLDENNSCALKDLAQRILGVKEVKTFKEASAKGMNTKEFYDYGMNDAIWTWQLHKIQNKQLYEQNLNKLFFEAEMPFQFVLRDMEINGILIDRKAADDLTKTVAEDIHNLESQMLKSIGMDWIIIKDLFGGIYYESPINFGSPKQLVDLITNKLGLEITVLTDNSNPSVGAESIQKLKGQHPFIDLLEKYAVATGMYEGFLDPLPGRINIDGRIRSSFGRTKTGRLRSSNPNLQNLPNPNPIYPIDFRGCVIAPEGKTLIVADYSGQELRVLAEVSQDKNMINAFLKDKDLHLATANKVFKLGIPEECLYRSHSDYLGYRKKYKNERHIGKNGINFPIVYGTTPYGRAKDLNISEKLAEEYINGFFELYPDIKKAIEKCGKILKFQHYVTTLAGRRRRFPGHLTAKNFRQAFNFLIQGYSADMIAIAAGKIRKLALSNPWCELKIILIVHDEIVMEVNEEYAETILYSIKYAMENAVKLSMPLIVDIGIGANYSEAK